jgi:microcystin-dependent protein
VDPFLGEIKMLPWNWAPKGWAVCNGAVLPIQQNTALFSLIGTTYGGNGVSTFGLPDLQGRVPMHRSINGQFGPEPIGAIAGSEQITITQSTLPLHNHPLLGTANAGDKKPPENYALATNTANSNTYYGSDSSVIALNPTSISMVGGGLPHNNMQHYQVVGFCIATVGYFPTRN